MPRILTDDAIDDVTYDLAVFLDMKFGIDIFEPDACYEDVREFLLNRLEDFSNGYRNYN